MWILLFKRETNIHIKALHILFYISEMETFYNGCETYYEEKGKRPYTRSEINTIVNELIAAKQKSTTKTRREYFLLKNYDFLGNTEAKILIKKSGKIPEDFEHVIPYEDLYEKLKEIHLATGHGSRDKMLHAIEKKWKITRPCIEIFLKSCEICQMKKSKCLKMIAKPIIAERILSRGLVDLIDLQSTPDKDYKWLLNFRDHARKFICLRPLKSKRAKEVAVELAKIFLNFGAPEILQSDNGREFSNSVIIELKKIWPNLHLINGRTRHPESQENVEANNMDVENMLRAWMIDNKTTSWSFGCYFVQWHKNNSFHCAIGRTPHEALFGNLPKMGLASTKIPTQILSCIENEDDFEKHIANGNVIKTAFADNISPKEVPDDTQEDDQSIPEFLEATKNYQEGKSSPNMTLTSEANEISLHDESGENLYNNQKEFALSKVISCTICGLIIYDNQTAQTCNLCLSENRIAKSQKNSYARMKRSTEQIPSTSKKLAMDISIGDCVLIPVDKFENISIAHLPNLIGVVTDFQNGAYQVGTRAGIIKPWFSRTDMQLANEAFLDIKEVDKDKLISLGEAFCAT